MGQQKRYVIRYEAWKEVIEPGLAAAALSGRTDHDVMTVTLACASCASEPVPAIIDTKREKRTILAGGQGFERTQLTKHFRSTLGSSYNYTKGFWICRKHPRESVPDVDSSTPPVKERWVRHDDIQKFSEEDQNKIARATAARDHALWMVNYRRARADFAERQYQRALSVQAFWNLRITQAADRLAAKRAKRRLARERRRHTNRK